MGRLLGVIAAFAKIVIIHGVERVLREVSHSFEIFRIFMEFWRMFVCVSNSIKLNS